MNLDEIMAVYDGSNGDATKSLYERLQGFAPRGVVALNLFRACKASSRAKVYRGRPGRSQPSYKAMAYEKKAWSIALLVDALRDHPGVIESWGWGYDAKSVGFEHVLYVDVPGCGQVSFHSDYRRDGPEYDGKWDGVQHQAPKRICRWIEAVLAGREVISEGERNVEGVGTEGAPGAGAARGPGSDEGVQEALDL